MGMIVSKLSNNIAWVFIGWILILGGFMLFIQGYKPLMFGVGILIILYRIVISYTEEYDSKIKH
jgi:hypothetical protein